MRLVRFTLESGEEAWINTANIEALWPVDESTTAIRLVSGTREKVLETLTTTVMALSNEDVPEDVREAHPSWRL